MNRAVNNDAGEKDESVRPIASDGPTYLLRPYRIPIVHSHYAELFARLPTNGLSHFSRKLFKYEDL